MTTGIYQILNRITGEKYIGSATDIKRRWQRHVNDLRKGRHHCSHLLFAWNKYGEEAFAFSVLEECDESSLLEKEQNYLPDEQTVESLKSKGFYNQSPTAGRPINSETFVFTEEIREKISEGNRERWKNQGYRKRMIEKVKASWRDPASREKRMRLANEQRNSDDHRKKNKQGAMEALQRKGKGKWAIIAASRQ